MLDSVSVANAILANIFLWNLISTQGLKSYGVVSHFFLLVV